MKRLTALFLIMAMLICTAAPVYAKKDYSDEIDKIINDMIELDEANNDNSQKIANGLYRLVDMLMLLGRQLDKNTFGDVIDDIAKDMARVDRRCKLANEQMLNGAYRLTDILMVIALEVDDGSDYDRILKEYEKCYDNAEKLAPNGKATAYLLNYCCSLLETICRKVGVPRSCSKNFEEFTDNYKDTINSTSGYEVHTNLSSYGILYYLRMLVYCMTDEEEYIDMAEDLIDAMVEAADELKLLEQTAAALYLSVYEAVIVVSINN